MQSDTKVLANELFLSGNRCYSFLLVILLFPAWNTDKGLDMGLEVEQTFGTYRDKHEDNNIPRISEWKGRNSLAPEGIVELHTRRPTSSFLIEEK